MFEVSMSQYVPLFFHLTQHCDYLQFLTIFIRDQHGSNSRVVAGTELVDGPSLAKKDVWDDSPVVNWKPWPH